MITFIKKMFLLWELDHITEYMKLNNLKFMMQICVNNKKIREASFPKYEI